MRRFLALIIPLLLVSPVAGSSLPSAERLGEGWAELTEEVPILPGVSPGDVVSSKRYVLNSGLAEVSVAIFAFEDDQQASLCARPAAEQVLGGMSIEHGLPAEYLARDSGGHTGGRVYALGPRLYVAVWTGEAGMRAEEAIASFVREDWTPGLLKTLENLWKTVLRQVSDPQDATSSAEPLTLADHGLLDTVASLWLTVSERYKPPEVEELYLPDRRRHEGLREVCQALETGGFVRAEVAVGAGNKVPAYVIRDFRGELEIAGPGGRFYPLEDRGYVFSQALIPRLTKQFKRLREDAALYWADVDRHLYEEVLSWECRREEAFRSQMGSWRLLLRWVPSLLTDSTPARVIKGGHELLGDPGMVTSLSACYAVYRDARQGEGDHSLAMDALRGHGWGIIGNPYEQALRLLGHEESSADQELQRILFNAYLKRTAVGESP